MIVRAQDRRSEPGPKVRLQPACVRAAQPSELDIEAALEFEREAKPLHIVARESHRQRALGAVADRPAGGCLELVAEGRPQTLALEIKCEQPFFTRLSLQTCGQHPGCSP